jgi:hypothetical protein
VVHEGDVISIDGSTGLVYAGEMPVVASSVVEYSMEASIWRRGCHPPNAGPRTTAVKISSATNHRKTTKGRV